MSSVRFICGTQDIHRELEQKLTEFLGTEDTLLFPSCMDANAGVFEAILTKDDVMISDRLVHASLVDGIRLCSAMHDTFKHSDMAHLEEKLQLHADKRFKLVITDGVFSMDGDTAKLDEMVALCEKYDAMLLVDDSHASGFIGKTGRGHAREVRRRRQDRHHHDDLRQGPRRGVRRLRLRPARARRDVPAAGPAVPLLQHHRPGRRRRRPQGHGDPVQATERRDKLETNAAYWRKGLTEAGFVLKEGDTPIVPVMLFNAKLAQDVSRALYDEGIYAIGFFFPVVPQGQARIRTQISAGHEIHHLDKALDAFTKVGKKFDILGKTKQEIIAKYGM